MVHPQISLNRFNSLFQNIQKLHLLSTRLGATNHGYFHWPEDFVVLGGLVGVDSRLYLGHHVPYDQPMQLLHLLAKSPYTC